MDARNLVFLAVALLTAPMLAGLAIGQGVGDLQTDASHPRAECNPDPEVTNDPDLYDLATGTYDPATNEYSGPCIPDEGDGRIDRTAPSTINGTRFSFLGINNFTWTWNHAYDCDNKDVNESTCNAAESNGEVDHYIVYNSTAAFTDVGDAQASRNVAPAAIDYSATEEPAEFVADEVEPEFGPLPNKVDFSGLQPGDVQHLAVTAVDTEGNEGPATFGTVTMPGSMMILSETTVSLVEDFEEYSYTISVNDLVQEAKKVAVNIELIDNNEALLNPLVISVESVELSRSNPVATVNFTLEDDDLGFGDRTYIIRHTVDESKVGRDLRFDTAPAADLTVQILENEVEPAINLAEEVDLEITEGEGNVSFQVKLSRQPTDDVFVHLTSSNSSRLPLITDHYLHFGIFDWDEYQTVTLHVVDDEVLNGDKPFTVMVAIDPVGTASEYADPDRAPDRQVIIMVLDDEEDEDEDGILDSEDKDPEDRFNKDWRPFRFNHQLAVDGTGVRFSWTAHQLDERVDHYIIWEFSDPENVHEVPVVEGQREYNTTIDFEANEVHRYGIQAVLSTTDEERDGTVPYDEEVAVPLGVVVFTQSYYNSICGVGNDTEKDSDGDGVCDDFEDIVGTDEDEVDTDEDGRDDHRELFVDGTDPADPDSRATFLPDWASSPWFIVGTVLILASLVLFIVSAARSGRDDEPRSSARS